MSKNLPAKRGKKKIVKKNKSFLNNKEKDQLIDVAEDVAKEEATSIIVKVAQVAVPIVIGALFKKVKNNNTSKKKK